MPTREECGEWSRRNGGKRETEYTAFLIVFTNKIHDNILHIQRIKLNVKRMGKGKNC